jgi:hypothetical protein
MGEIPASNSLHEIELEEQTAESCQYYVVRVQLFANLAGPVYRIVSGRRLNANKPTAILLAEASAQHSGHKTPVAEPTSCPIPTGLWGQLSPSASATPPPKLKRYLRAETKSRSR